jgi:hypothetical protein
MPLTPQQILRMALFCSFEDSNANQDSSNNVAGGADAHIKYSSENKFGAVLMTREPVTLRAYHQERMFLQWLERNRRQLHIEYGSQLRKYGLWIVTKTYSTPGCSINAWMNNNREALVTVKAKASMLGELGSQLSMEDTVMDKDWSHYSAPEGVVVFVDGIEIKPSEWWLRSIVLNLPIITRSKSDDAGVHARTIPRSSNLLGPQHPGNTEEASTLYLTPEKQPLRRFSIANQDRPDTLVADHGEEETVLQDAGLLQFSRAGSIRRPSRPVSMVETVSAPSSRTPSLRREKRSVSDTKIQL